MALGFTQNFLDEEQQYRFGFDGGAVEFGSTGRRGWLSPHERFSIARI